MEAQLKRGFLDICVLAALAREDSYGYQIIKDVPASLGL
ncbi:MAG: PadR family transcriptional regulator, partial [Coriobacteriaceae bacterium]